MSVAPTPPQPAPERFLPGSSSLDTILLVVGAIALVLSAIGAFINPHQFAHSWLFAFMYFYTIAVGAFFWTILHHAVDADWTVLVRRQFENVASLFPYLFIAFLPALFCGPQLWSWMRPEVRAEDALLALKQPYLSVPFFVIRLIFYFGFFSAAALYYRWRSTAQDADGSPVHTVYMRKWSYLCIPLMAISVTFSAIDWLMGMDFHWFSTMWGVYIFAGSAQSSMATVILIVFALRSLGYLKPVSGEHSHVMGKLLLAFTVFWAYIAFSQYLLIWYANIPEETEFFIRRNVGSWTYVSMFLVVGHFVIPFVFLLTQAVKKSFAVLSIVAVWLLIMHGIDLYWIILPQIHPQGLALSWLDFTCFIGLASMLAYFFLQRLRQVELFPARDPRLMECVRLTN